MTTTIEPAVVPTELPPLETQTARQDIYHLLDRLIAEKGEHYVDKSHSAVLYNPQTRDYYPGCLVGHLLVLKGMTPQYIAQDMDVAIRKAGWGDEEKGLVSRGIRLNDKNTPWGDIRRDLHRAYPV